MTRRRAVMLFAAGLALVPVPLHGQEVRTAVIPDSIHVGDVFRVAVRVIAEAEAAVTFPDTLAVPSNVEAAARRQVSADTAEDGNVAHTAVYPLTAWRTGRVELPDAEIAVDRPRGASAVRARFAPFDVSTLLPPDTAGIEPRPARDVIGSSRLLWPVVLAFAIALAAMALAVWLWRRRGKDEVADDGPLPRDAALAELDRIRKLGYLEQNDVNAFYTAVSSVLRRYTAQLDPRWGAELTTSELWQSMQRVLTGAPSDTAIRQPRPAGDESHEAVELYSMLGRADLVKFARARPAVAEANAVWVDARAWVEQFPPPEDATRGEEEA